MGASPEHHERMQAAIELEAQAQTDLLEGRRERARERFAAAAAAYRASWELASGTSYGRLVGMLKAAVLAGGGEEEAAYARGAIGDSDRYSVTAAYVRALACLIAGDDGEACRWTAVMLRSPGPFSRAAEAITALARSESSLFQRVLQEIVRDFEARSKHLTGVAIADTALMLEALARRRGMRPIGPASPLVPAL
ncbi:MAG: hypothetical protein KGJ43_04860 [Acidobacteriota bacterium]|nr:hypothetical protein [Acidobacteriota bacterium]